MNDAAGRWGRHMDELAAAATALLMRGAGAPQPLVDPHSALAARDTVLQQLRELTAAVGDVPQFAEVSELTLADVVHRPAHALHHALSGLPRALPFGAAELAAADLPRLPPYEQAWQRAAGATLGLEVYLDALGRLPDATAWQVLRDLTDVAAALPYLDHDLSEALHPGLVPDRDLDGAYRTLTHPGHDALRVVTAEVRARVPASLDRLGGSAKAATDGQQPPQTRAPAAGAAATDDPVAHRPRGAADRLVKDGSSADALAQAMVRYAHAVSARGSIFPSRTSKRPLGC